MEVVIFRYSFTIISSITLRTWLNSYRYFVVVWTANNPLSIEVNLFNSVQVGVVRVHVQRHQYPYILYRKSLVHLHVNKTKIHMKGFALGLALKQRRNVTRKSPGLDRSGQPGLVQ